MEPPAATTLRAIPLFADLADDALASVANVATEFQAGAGTVLVEVGQPGTGLFVLEDGEVRVDLPEGPVMLGPGEFFGELALLTDRPHVARVQAWTPVRCLAIRRGDFARLIDEQPRIAVAMLPVLAERLAGMVPHT